MDVFEPAAAAWRFYEDDGSPSESTSTPIALQNTNITRDISVGGDKQVHLRYRMDEVGTGDIDGATTDDYQLQFQVNSGGGWSDVTASSSRVQTDTSSELSDGSATTNRTQDGISNGLGDAFVAGEQEDGDGEITDSQLTGNDYTEHVWALDLISADWTADDFVTFRLRFNGGNMANNVIPRITDLPPFYAPDADKFRFYEDDSDGGTSEATSTPIAAEDTDLTSRDVNSDSDLHLRWNVQETGGLTGPFTNEQYLWASVNSGTYFQITTSTSEVKADSGSELVNGADTTNRTTDGISDGTGSFFGGEQSELGIITGRFLQANDFNESVFSITLISADLSDADTIDFKLTENNAPPPDISEEIQSIIPRITVSKSATSLKDILMGPGIIPFAR